MIPKNQEVHRYSEHEHETRLVTPIDVPSVANGTSRHQQNHTARVDDRGQVKIKKPHEATA
jgi:hypothetical protein